MRSISSNSFNEIEFSQHEDMKMQVYSILKKMIMRREFTANERLDALEIAKTLGVSRTPVRDAINMLTSEGFVKTIPRTGTFVQGIYEQDLTEIFQYRLMIESHSLELGMRNIQQDVLSTIIEEWGRVLDEQYDGYKFMEVDAKLHKHIVQASRNSRIISSYEWLNCHVQTVKGYYAQDKSRMVEANKEHREILSCIRSDDLQGAQQALRFHLNETLSRLLKIIQTIKVF